MENNNVDDCSLEMNGIETVITSNLSVDTIPQLNLKQLFPYAHSIPNLSPDVINLLRNRLIEIMEQESDKEDQIKIIDKFSKLWSKGISPFQVLYIRQKRDFDYLISLILSCDYTSQLDSDCADTFNTMIINNGLPSFETICKRDNEYYNLEKKMNEISPVYLTLCYKLSSDIMKIYMDNQGKYSFVSPIVSNQKRYFIFISILLHLVYIQNQ